MQVRFIFLFYKLSLKWFSSKHVNVCTVLLGVFVCMFDKCSLLMRTLFTAGILSGQAGLGNVCQGVSMNVCE